MTALQRWYRRPVAVLAVLAIAALILAAAKGAFGGGKLSFVCEIEDGPARKHRYTIKFGDKLYLVDGVMGLNVVEEPGTGPAAELFADSHRQWLHACQEADAA